MKYVDDYDNPEAARRIAARIKELDVRATFMEVCGTHTTAISRYALRPLLSPQIELISGPGCPVCVTSDEDIDRAIAVSRLPGVVLATFGDMMKVPGTGGSLADAAAGGARVDVVYSPLDAVETALAEPESKVVFLGVGFETTAPVVAATVIEAERRGAANFFVLPLHKLVPPALETLISMDDFHVDGFILPGHVSSIIGSNAYRFLSEQFGIPGVVAGFEANDILEAVLLLAQMKTGEASVKTEYSRAVKPQGNRKALAVMDRVFKRCDSTWRGLGVIPGSGLALREDY
ncbi:MAG: hydrogenase formation protein HypD, partial [Actinobacteria bacterium]|nr:hydrogenase formation protein HypD [Actinomycetota bacterium]